MNVPSGSELRRRLRVGWGLAKIELHERAGEQSGRKLGAARRRRTARAAKAAVPLRQWERISESSFAAYTGGASVARISGLLELVPPGSRVLDIGIGFGYVTGVVLRDLRPS